MDPIRFDRICLVSPRLASFRAGLIDVQGSDRSITNGRDVSVLGVALSRFAATSRRDAHPLHNHRPCESIGLFSRSPPFLSSSRDRETSEFSEATATRRNPEDFRPRLYNLYNERKIRTRESVGTDCDGVSLPRPMQSRYAISVSLKTGGTRRDSSPREPNDSWHGDSSLPRRRRAQISNRGDNRPTPV